MQNYFRIPKLTLTSVEIITVHNMLYARMSVEAFCVNALMGMKEMESTAHLNVCYYPIIIIIIIMAPRDCL